MRLYATKNARTLFDRAIFVKLRTFERLFALMQFRRQLIFRVRQLSASRLRCLYALNRDAIFLYDDVSMFLERGFHVANTCLKTHARSFYKCRNFDFSNICRPNQ